VAFVKRASGATVYVDGIAGTTTATPNSASLTDTNPVRIGADATTGGYVTGQLDEIAVYNGALGAVRVLAHCRLGTQLDSTALVPTITAPTDGSSTTNTSRADPLAVPEAKVGKRRGAGTRLRRTDGAAACARPVQSIRQLADRTNKLTCGCKVVQCSL
jgi:hypothetical protein